MVKANNLGKKAQIIGTIMEDLDLTKKKAWYTLMFPNGEQITINKKYCKLLEGDEIL